MAVQRNDSGMRNARGSRTGAGRAGKSGRGGSGRSTMPGRAGVSGPKKRKRRISKKQQAIYRRRRIVVGVILLLILALIGFCIYSLGRGVSAINTAIHHDEVYAISRESVPTPKKTSSVKDCSTKNLSLQLSSKSQSMPVGGTMEFTATLVHEGTGSCLVDGSDSSRILTITSGNETIYRSDVCPADSRLLLMAKGDKDSQQMKWNGNANATLTECTDQSDWPTVNAGTYVAQLSLKDDPKVKSEKVVFTVQ
ncbi:hypothetical protein [Bifidobacterium callitrichidarum]|uniref:hypothetical protein n=1 Tax=Bifidobacterium callitrichidarum TaxID=2052941 RepID=UPI0014762E0A|nr:hypothetical protein [Bifidobacterium callitrichidarum]